MMLYIYYLPTCPSSGFVFGFAVNLCKNVTISFNWFCDCLTSKTYNTRNIIAAASTYLFPVEKPKYCL